MQYVFNKELAAVTGVETAVVLHVMYQLVQENQKAHKNLIDGRYWVNLNCEELAEYFSFWTKWPVKRYLQRFADSGLLLHKRMPDRTIAYTLSEPVVKHYEEMEQAIEAQQLKTVFRKLREDRRPRKLKRGKVRDFLQKRYGCLGRCILSEQMPEDMISYIVRVEKKIIRISSCIMQGSDCIRIEIKQSKKWEIIGYYDFDSFTIMTQFS